MFPNCQSAQLSESSSGLLTNYIIKKKLKGIHLLKGSLPTSLNMCCNYCYFYPTKPRIFWACFGVSKLDVWL